jgi:hypothetical protein
MGTQSRERTSWSSIGGRLASRSGRLVAASSGAAPDHPGNQDCQRMGGAYFLTVKQQMEPLPWVRCAWRIPAVAPLRLTGRRLPLGRRGRVENDCCSRYGAAVRRNAGRIGSQCPLAPASELAGGFSTVTRMSTSTLLAGTTRASGQRASAAARHPRSRSL